MQEELLRKILEKLESIDEKLEDISERMEKPLPVIVQETVVKKSPEKTQTVVFTTKKD